MSKDRYPDRIEGFDWEPAGGRRAPRRASASSLALSVVMLGAGVALAWALWPSDEPDVPPLSETTSPTETTSLTETAPLVPQSVTAPVRSEASPRLVDAYADDAPSSPSAAELEQSTTSSLPPIPIARARPESGGTQGRITVTEAPQRPAGPAATPPAQREGSPAPAPTGGARTADYQSLRRYWLDDE